MRAAAKRVANNPSALPLQTCRLIAGSARGPHEAFSESLITARLMRSYLYTFLIL